MQVINKFNQATVLRPNGHRLIDGPMVKIILPNFIALLKDETIQKANDSNTITVFKSPAMCIMLMILQKQAVMAAHLIKQMQTLQVLEGMLVAVIEEKTIKIHSGEILVLHSNISYSISAAMQTFLLLTINNLQEADVKGCKKEYETLHNEIF